MVIFRVSRFFLSILKFKKGTMFFMQRSQYVINTHFHGDHTGNNSMFGENSIIIGHHYVTKRLKQNKKLNLKSLPEISYSTHLNITFGNNDIAIKHFPNAHTDTDSVVFINNSNIVHMGDLLFNKRLPYIDLKNGGSVNGYINALKKILATIDENTIIIPGHGDIANSKDLKQNIKMIEQSINFVAAQIQKKRNLKQIKKQGLPKKWRSWSWRFINEEKWLTTLYNDLHK